MSNASTRDFGYLMSILDAINKIIHYTASYKNADEFYNDSITFDATQNTGVTPDEVKEVLLQVAIYAGVPAANSAIAIAKKVYVELAEQSNENS